MCELIISVGVSLNMLISYVISGDKNSKLWENQEFITVKKGTMCQ
jgi:hypothetical protein